ncbi:GPI ethanolamine phosphate transferase 3 [Hyalella azteca]|uniref:GPI ethanolamine phosphate transferase 3 n=2 Tax=Hyalella azteca TaxID=294128 RepID=A0A8B7NK20_HYAAZ|nr:GPI ethanolamine phosphate transferase 3 [Hyalella azteca]
MVLVGGRWKVLLLLVLPVASFIAGLLVFIQGFLLTRHALLDASTCSDFGELSENGCWMPKKFNKTVLLLIDGLRYDFAAEDDTVKSAVVPAFLNKMPVFKEIISGIADIDSKGTTHLPWRGSGFLAKFIADAPTTTMQRLKGLITGGLPTFIDLAQNFDSGSISEDNLVLQLEQHGRSITVLGDDTWRNLFPNSFNRDFLFPSFNVWDLDTVDNGILEHLDAELNNPRCDVLIAHFLGVDHVGHRYGPNHPSMTRKLRQMNDVVRHVAQSIHDDTLLLVFGDHGMTATGDHGGDSDAEVTAAFFVYSPGLVKNFSSYYRSSPHSSTNTNESNINELLFQGEIFPVGDWRHQTPHLIQQVSLVPTVSLLLGVPIPYSSIGSVVPQLFGSLQDQVMALSLNVKQVHRYLSHYNDKFSSNRFPLSMWQKLVSLKVDIDDIGRINLSNSTHLEAYKSSLKEEAVGKDLEQIKNHLLMRRKSLYEEYLSLAKAMCEEVWATFDVTAMAGGIFLMIVALTNLAIISLSLTKKEEIFTYFFKGNCAICTIIMFTLLLRSWLPLPVLNFIPAFLAGVVVVFHASKVNSLSVYAAYKDLWPLLIFGFVCCSSFSNSFVVHEDAVIGFSLVSLLAYSTLRLLLIHKTRTFEKGKIKNQASISSVLAYIAVSVFIVVGVAVRWSSSYRRCREEQSSCEPSTNYLPLSSIDSALQNKRFFIGVFLLILTVSLPRQWLSYCGNLNGMRAAVFVYRNATIICGVMIATYWALDAVPKPSALILTYMNYPPRVIYALAAITILITFVKPLLIFQLHKNKRQYNVTNAHMLIPELFNNLKEDFGRNKRPDSDCETPVVYGLATAISAPLVTTGSMAAIVVLLLVGDGMALPLLLLILTVAGFCFLHAAICWQNPLLDSVMRLRWVGPVVWCLLSLHGFYSTGHQTTFPTLPWSAAFVGRVETGAGGTLAPALLVLLHTFSGHLLLGLLLPLLPLAPLTLGAILPTLRKKKSGDELQRGEFVLLDRPEVFLASLSSFAVSYVSLHCAKVLLTCISCLFLRRHLMMWKIFAPHLIFESVGLVVTLCSVSFSVLLALRTLDVLQTWAIRISFLKEKPS